jgi:alkaline phosphatase
MASPNASGGITDSAASGTAMATGRKAKNGVISRGVPGGGQDATSALELQQVVARRVGLVTTATKINDATPAAFGAHADSRYSYAEIAADFFEQTRPNILFGWVGTGITKDAATAAGYTVITTSEEMLLLDTASESHISGQFTSSTTPVLADMVVTALDVVDQAQEGFFLLVEHEGPDTGGHANDLELVIDSVLELRDAFDAAVDWVGDRDDLLVIVGADHETGGLTITETNPTAGQIPAHTWGTTTHTNRLVPFFASGPGAAAISGTIDNTDLFPLLAGLEGVAFREGQAGYLATADTFLDQGAATTANGKSTSLWLDLDYGGSERQALLRFRGLFGAQDGRIPWRAHIEVALLELHVADPGDSLQAHRMLKKWTPGDGWSDFGGDGIQADDVEASAQAEVVTSTAVAAGTLTLDVTESVRHWQRIPSRNHGWVLLATGNNGVDINSSEGEMPPRLRVYFRPID